MTSDKQLYGMLDRFVDSVETMLKNMNQYETHKDSNSMMEVKRSQKQLDDMCFKYMKWKNKNGKFYE